MLAYILCMHINSWNSKIMRESNTDKQLRQIYQCINWRNFCIQKVSSVLSGCDWSPAKEGSKHDDNCSYQLDGVQLICSTPEFESLSLPLDRTCRKRTHSLLATHALAFFLEKINGISNCDRQTELCYRLVKSNNMNELSPLEKSRRTPLTLR